MNTVASDFETLLNESVRIHGHLCPGQVLGVNMREVHSNGKVLCKPCAEGGYYTIEDKSSC